jgi:hypothetical protein
MCDSPRFAVPAGPDANVRRIANSLREAIGRRGRVVEYDWFAFVGDQLQAPYNAQRIGDHLASQIARERSLRKLHVVGISVGAFAADRLVQRFSNARGKGGEAEVKLTLLDPFTARGLPGLIFPSSAYGVKTFGKSADVAESVFNTDDPVPSTALPLQNAINFDITANAERATFVPLDGDSMHSWPAAWYGMHPTALDGSGSNMVRGSVATID